MPVLIKDVQRTHTLVPNSVQKVRMLGRACCSWDVQLGCTTGIYSGIMYAPVNEQKVQRVGYVTCKPMWLLRTGRYDHTQYVCDSTSERQYQFGMYRGRWHTSPTVYRRSKGPSVDLGTRVISKDGLLWSHTVRAWQHFSTPVKLRVFGGCIHVPGQWPEGPRVGRSISKNGPLWSHTAILCCISFDKWVHFFLTSTVISLYNPFLYFLISNFPSF